MAPPLQGAGHRSRTLRTTRRSFVVDQELLRQTSPQTATFPHPFLSIPRALTRMPGNPLGVFPSAMPSALPFQGAKRSNSGEA